MTIIFHVADVIIAADALPVLVPYHELNLMIISYRHTCCKISCITSTVRTTSHLWKQKDFLFLVSRFVALLDSLIWNRKQIDNYKLTPKSYNYVHIPYTRTFSSNQQIRHNKHKNKMTRLIFTSAMCIALLAATSDAFAPAFVAPHRHSFPAVYTPGSHLPTGSTRVRSTALQMNLFDRFTRVAKSNLNNILKTLEDPEKIMSQALEDMQVSFCWKFDHVLFSHIDHSWTHLIVVAFVVVVDAKRMI